MKTLFKIFFKNFYFNVFKIFLVMVIFMVFAFNASWLGLGPQISTALSTLSLIIAVAAPTLIFFINSTFPQNVPWLINQNFTRLELLKFFLVSQSLKFIFFCLLYIFYFYFISFFPSRFDSILSNDHTAMDNFYYYFLFLGTLLIFFLPLQFKHNTNTQSQLKVKDLIIRSFVFLVGLALLQAVERNLIPELYFLIMFLGVFTHFSSRFLNLHFKLFPDPRMKIYSLIISALVMIPPFIGIEFLKITAADTSYSVDVRSNVIVGLGSLAPALEKDDKIGLLINSTPFYYKELLTLFGKDLDLDDIFSASLNPKKAKHFIDYASRPYPINDVNKIIGFMNSVKKKFSLGYDFDRYSYSFFVNQHCDRFYLEFLLTSPESYSQLAGIYMAYKNLKREEFLSLYQAHAGHLSPHIKADIQVQKLLTN